MSRTIAPSSSILRIARRSGSNRRHVPCTCRRFEPDLRAIRSIEEEGAIVLDIKGASQPWTHPLDASRTRFGETLLYRASRRRVARPDEGHGLCNAAFREV